MSGTSKGANETLRLELEEERSPQRLAARATELGLVPAAPIGLPAPG